MLAYCSSAIPVNPSKSSATNLTGAVRFLPYRSPLADQAEGRGSEPPFFNLL